MKKKSKPEPSYFIEEKNGRYYVYKFEIVPAQTLLDIKRSREDAEQAIKEHKAGKHPTEWEPGQ